MAQRSGNGPVSSRAVLSIHPRARQGSTLRFSPLGWEDHCWMWPQPQGDATGQRLQANQGGSKPTFPGENRPSTPSIPVAPKLFSPVQHLSGEICKANNCKELGHLVHGAPQAHAGCLGEAPAFLLNGLSQSMNRSGSPPTLF